MKSDRMSWAWRTAVLVGAGAVAAGCASVASTTTTSTTSTTSGSGATSTTGPAVNGPGVSATRIDIGSIETKTGPLAGYFNGLSQGMIAYFNMINATGGINGRKLMLTANLDDGGSSTQFTQDVHTLIDQDHVFAAGVASAWFTPDYFVSTKTPTYGYNVSGNWETAPNLFAAGGSTQIYSSGISTIAYFVKQVKASAIALISYGKAIASSYDACTADSSGLRAAGYHVVLDDVSANLNGTFSSDVQRMRTDGADLIISCMQASDNITLARNVQQYGLHAKQLWFNGYDQPLLNQYSSVMQGVYLNNTGSVPFEAATDTAKYGNTYAGMQSYVAEMNKYEPAFTYNDVSFQGWQSAALLAAGIQAAGNDLSQTNVVAVTNKITNFNGGGTSSPVNWAVSHTSTTLPNCSSWIQVQGKVFAVVFATGKQVFVCVGANSKDPVPVAAPPGTPGS